MYSSERRVILQTSPFTLRPFCLKALAPQITWSRHPRGNMIARAKFAFLLLDDRIIHMDVVEDGGQILMAQ